MTSQESFTSILALTYPCGSRRFKNFLLKNHWVIFKQTWHKAPWVKMILFFFSNEGSRPSQRGINCKNSKNTLLNFLKSSSPEPMGHFQPNLAQDIGLRRDNYKIAKMH